MFGKIVFAGTVNYDVIAISVMMGFLEKCGRTLFEIVSTAAVFETIKYWIF